VSRKAFGLGGVLVWPVFFALQAAERFTAARSIQARQENAWAMLYLAVQRAFF